MPKAHRTRPASYPIGAMPDYVAPPPVEVEPEDSRRPPAPSAPKAEWVAYAAEVGVKVPAKATKAQIRKAVG